MTDARAHAMVLYVYKLDGQERWNHDPACCWCGAWPYHVTQIDCKAPDAPHALFTQSEYRWEMHR